MLGVTIRQDSCEIGQPNYEGVRGANWVIFSQIAPFHMKFIWPWNLTRRRFQLYEGGWLLGVSLCLQVRELRQIIPWLNQGWGAVGGEGGGISRKWEREGVWLETWCGGRN